VFISSITDRTEPTGRSVDRQTKYGSLYTRICSNGTIDNMAVVVKSREIAQVQSASNGNLRPTAILHALHGQLVPTLTAFMWERLIVYQNDEMCAFSFNVFRGITPLHWPISSSTPTWSLGLRSSREFRIHPSILHGACHPLLTSRKRMR
jgi:hypothetical protein